MHRRSPNAVHPSINKSEIIRDVDQRSASEVYVQAVKDNEPTSVPAAVPRSKSDLSPSLDDGDDEEFEIAVAISLADADENNNEKIDPDETKGSLLYP